MLAYKFLTISLSGDAGLSHTSDELEGLGHKLLGVFFGHSEGIEGLSRGIVGSMFDDGKIEVGEGFE